MNIAKKVSYKMPMLKDGTIPYYVHSEHWGGDGNVHQSPDRGDNITWHEVEPFYALVKFIGIDKGSHGASRYILENVDTGAKYMMMVIDVLGLLQNHTIMNGVVGGKFIIQKRGANYGVRFLGA